MPIRHRELFFASDGKHVLQAIDDVPPPSSPTLAGPRNAARLLDICGKDEERMRERLRQLNLNEDEVLRRLRSAERPRTRPAGDGILLVWRHRDERDRPVPLVLLCLPGIVVLVREYSIPGIEDWLREARGWSRPGGLSSAGLLLSLFDHFLTRDLGEYVKERDRVNELVHRAIVRPTTIDPSHVLRVKDRFSTLSSQCETLAFLLNLAQSDGFWTSGMEMERESMRVLQQGLHDFEGALERQDGRLMDVLRRNELEQQRMTTKRLNILTVLSAVFLPLTLIAGIYGMNFTNMPALRAQWGYPATMMSMVMVAAGMLIVFWRRGWFQ